MTYNIKYQLSTDRFVFLLSINQKSSITLETQCKLFVRVKYYQINIYN